MCIVEVCQEFRSMESAAPGNIFNIAVNSFAVSAYALWRPGAVTGLHLALCEYWGLSESCAPECPLMLPVRACFCEPRGGVCLALHVHSLRGEWPEQMRVQSRCL